MKVRYNGNNYHIIMCHHKKCFHDNLFFYSAIVKAMIQIKLLLLYVHNVIHFHLISRIKSCLLLKLNILKKDVRFIINM